MGCYIYKISIVIDKYQVLKVFIIDKLLRNNEGICRIPGDFTEMRPIFIFVHGDNFITSKNELNSGQIISF